MADLARKDGQRKSPRGPARPTIVSVAEMAGVSITAVSRILNHSDSHRYSKEVEARVRQVCEKVAYRPSSMARSLAKQTNPGIGILCQSLTDVNIVRVVDRAVELAAAHGLHMVVSSDAPPAERVASGGPAERGVQMGVLHACAHLCPRLCPCLCRSPMSRSLSLSSSTQTGRRTDTRTDKDQDKDTLDKD